jgi:DNA invertase Pin-like site-specific DNA recombinase
VSEHPKVSATHLRRHAIVYVRQSTLAQVERNPESTARQYDLVERAVALGWPRSGVRVIDDDLGASGASTAGRAGFAELAAQVGLGQVGIVLSLECSRLARNNALSRFQHKAFYAAHPVMPRRVVKLQVGALMGAVESA